MATRVQLKSIEAFKTFSAKPVAVQIGKDCDGFFRKVSRDEFFAIQDKLTGIDKPKDVLSAEDAKDPVKVEAQQRESMKASCEVVAGLMVDLLTDELGNKCFKDEDKDTLANTMGLQFVREFIEALMKAQGISKEEVASAEAEFRQ